MSKKNQRRRDIYKKTGVMIAIKDLEAAGGDEFDIFNALEFNDIDRYFQNRWSDNSWENMKWELITATRLARSIIDKGVLAPLIVKEKSDHPGKYLVVEGRRRLGTLKGFAKKYLKEMNIKPEMRCDILRDDLTKEEMEEIVIDTIFTPREKTPLGKALLQARLWEFVEDKLKPYRTGKGNFDLTNCQGKIPEDFKEWLEDNKDERIVGNVVEAYMGHKFGVSWRTIHRARLVAEGIGLFIKEWYRRFGKKYQLPEIGNFDHTSPKEVSRLLSHGGGGG